MLDKCVSIRASSANPRISPLTAKYDYPLIPLSMRPLDLLPKRESPAFKNIPCFKIRCKHRLKHFSSFKVKDEEPAARSQAPRVAIVYAVPHFRRIPKGSRTGTT